jgi:hypothetical protein
VRQCGFAAMRQYGSTAVRQCGYAALRQYGSTAVRQCGGTALRLLWEAHLGGEAAKDPGGS